MTAVVIFGFLAVLLIVGLLLRLAVWVIDRLLLPKDVVERLREKERNHRRH